MSPHLIQEMSASLDNFYKLQRTAKLQGNMKLYGKITVGAVVSALAAGMAADALFGDGV